MTKQKLLNASSFFFMCLAVAAFVFAIGIAVGLVAHAPPKALNTMHNVYHDWAPYLLVLALIALGQYNSIHIGRLDRRIDQLERNEQCTTKTTESQATT